MNTPKAYLYSRVSSKAQINGTGIDRQDERGLEYYNRSIAPTGMPLDNTVRCDKGRSAFKGGNLKEDGALRKILDEIAAGTIATGSILIVENLDRISRQGPKLARQVLARITDHDVEIHILNITQNLKRNWENDFGQSVVVDNELQRAWKESLCKSDRIGRAWQSKREKAAATGKAITENCPVWLEVADDGERYVEKPEAVAVIQEMFDLAAQGMGAHNILKRLNGRLQKLMENQKGPSLSWVSRTLDNRAVLGWYEHADDEPISLFPQIVDQPTFDAARVAINGRIQNDESKMKAKGGLGRYSAERVGNLFPGMVWDVTDGEARAMHYQRCVRDGKISGEYLRTAKSGDDREENSISYLRFEHDMLAFFDAADWKAISGETESESLKHAVTELNGVFSEIDKTNRQIADKNAAMDDETDIAVIKVLAARIAKYEAGLVSLTERKNVLQAKVDAERSACAALYSPEKLLELVSQTAATPEVFEVRLRLKTEIARRVSRIEINFNEMAATITLVNDFHQFLVFQP
jgi:DNA invertase Pin-like site-specific DNA recombinase